MFTHLQQTITILTARTAEIERANQPGIVFMAKEEIEPSRISRKLANLMATLIFAFGVGYIGRAIERAFHIEPPTVSMTPGVIAVALVLLIYAIGNRHLHSCVLKLWERLRIADRIAPYVGRGIEETYRVLKG